MEHERILSAVPDFYQERGPEAAFSTLEAIHKALDHYARPIDAQTTAFEITHETAGELIGVRCYIVVPLPGRRDSLRGWPIKLMNHANSQEGGRILTEPVASRILEYVDARKTALREDGGILALMDFLRHPN